MSHDFHAIRKTHIVDRVALILAASVMVVQGSCEHREMSVVAAPSPSATAAVASSSNNSTNDLASTPAWSQAPATFTRGAAPPLSVGPISFFQISCARCHGYMGSMYAETMARADAATRRTDVDRMVKGPAQTTLGAAELESLVAFHNALATNEPFVAVIRVTNNSIEIEATPGSLVRIESSLGTFDATASGEWNWTATVPRSWTDASVVATLNGITVRCAPAPGANSHPSHSK